MFLYILLHMISALLPRACTNWTVGLCMFIRYVADFNLKLQQVSLTALLSYIPVCLECSRGTAGHLILLWSRSGPIIAVTIFHQASTPMAGFSSGILKHTGHVWNNHCGALSWEGYPPSSRINALTEFAVCNIKYQHYCLTIAPILVLLKKPTRTLDV